MFPTLTLSCGTDLHIISGVLLLNGLLLGLAGLDGLTPYEVFFFQCAGAFLLLLGHGLRGHSVSVVLLDHGHCLLVGNE